MTDTQKATTMQDPRDVTVTSSSKETNSFPTAIKEAKTTGDTSKLAGIMAGALNKSNDRDPNNSPAEVMSSGRSSNSFAEALANQRSTAEKHQRTSLSTTEELEQKIANYRAPLTEGDEIRVFRAQEEAEAKEIARLQEILGNGNWRNQNLGSEAALVTAIAPIQKKEEHSIFDPKAIALALKFITEDTHNSGTWARTVDTAKNKKKSRSNLN